MDFAEAANEMGVLTTVAIAAAAEMLPRILAAIVILAIGYLVARLAGEWVRRIIVGTPRIDSTLAPVLSTALHYVILIFVFVAALSQLGVQTTSVLAVIGAAGLAIGLALQGTLSNIAAGFMLLWLRPFKEGDYIETASVAGTVREIGLFATQVDTYDGIYRFIPNSSLWNTPLSNLSRNPARMADIGIGIPYDADIARARSIVLDVAGAHPLVLDTPPPKVFVKELGDSAVAMRLHAWIGTADFWPTQRELVERTKNRLEAANIEKPFPQRVVRVVGDSGAGSVGGS